MAHPESPLRDDYQATPPTAPAASQQSATGGFAGILLLGVGGAICATFLGLFVAIGAVRLGTSDAEWAGEGAGMAIVALFFLSALIVGPLTFFAIVMARSRRKGDVGRGALPWLAGLSFLVPTLVTGSMLFFYTNNRGTFVLGLLAIASMIAAFGLWTLASMRKVPLSKATLMTGVAIAIIAATFLIARLNVDAHQASTLEEARLTLALVDEDSPLLANWTIDDLFTSWYPGADSDRIWTRFTYRSGETKEVTFEARASGWSRCDHDPCPSQVTTERGRLINAGRESYGLRGDITFGGEHLNFTSSTNVSDTELVALVDALELVSADTWISEDERLNPDS